MRHPAWGPIRGMGIDDRSNAAGRRQDSAKRSGSRSEAAAA
jgi:hypothetical protein